MTFDRNVTPPKVLFVDWDGVLCEQPFWHHLPCEHPLRSEVAPALFSDRETLERWMRGELDDIDAMAGIVSPDAMVDALLQLQRSVLRFQASEQMLSVVEDACDTYDAMAVLATDNMPVFERLVERTEFWGRGLFSDVLCSSGLGALKRNPERFYGAALREWNLAPEQALLIDDREENCAAFRAWGGQAIQFRSPTQAREEILGAGQLVRGVAV